MHALDRKALHKRELQGSHAPLKVRQFYNPKFEALEVLENRTGV